MATQKVRQEINLLNAVITASQSGARAQIDTTQFLAGTVAYYFEIVAKIASGTSTVTLRRNGTTTDDATISLTGSTTYIRFRSSSFTPPAGQTSYFINISGGTTPSIIAARVVVLVSDTTGIYGMETQIEIGNEELAKTNTTAAALNNPKYFKYNAADWDGTITAYAEVVWSYTGTGNGTIKIQKDGGSDNFTFADDTTIVSASSAASPTRTRVALTLTDGRNYRITTVDSSSMGSLNVYSAKVVIQQDGAPDAGNKTQYQTTDDTYYGTSFYPGPNDTDTILQYGGWGDAQYNFLAFDLSSAPAWYKIASATFNIYDGNPSVNDAVIQVNRITASWSGSTLTRASHPTDDATNWGSLASVGGGSARWVAATITSLVSKWLDGTYTNNGLKLNPTVTSNQNNGQFNSKENVSGNIPYIEITPATALTKIQAEYLLANTSFGGSTGLKDFDTLYDPAEWAGTMTFIHEGDGAAAGTGDIKLQSDPNGTPADVTNSTITDTIQREQSSTMTMPGASATLDVNVTGTGTLSASRILAKWVAASGTAYTSTLSETITFTDTLLKQATKKLSETITFTDTLLKQLVRILTETITYTDTLIASRLRFSVLTDTVTFTDTLLKQGVKLLADTVTYTDTLIRKATKVLSDTATLTDTLLKQASRTFSETITYTDTLLKQGGKFLSDTITYTDTLLKKATKVLSDTATLTDTLIKQLTRILADTITYTDTLTASKVTLKLLTETITFTDTLLKQGAKVLSDIITYTDTLVKQTVRTLTETITYSDTLTAFKVAVKQLTETITFSDTFLKSMSRTFSEVITYTDTLTKRLTRTLSDTLTFTDTFIKQTTRTFSEVITYTDTLLKRLSRTMSETLTLSDTLLKLPARTFSEVITYTDTLLKRGGKFLSDTITLSDTFLRQISKRFTETLTLIDTVLASNVTVVISVLLNEVLTFADTLNKRIPKTLTEVITLTDTFLKSFVPVMKMAVLTSIYATQAVLKKSATAFTLLFPTFSAILRAPEATENVIEDTKKDATIKLNQ